MARIHLPRTTRVWINCIGFGVWITGVGWLVLHYLLKRTDDLGLPSNASEPWWLKLHGAFAFLSLWTAGMLWSVHVVAAWNRHRHRRSGGSLFALVVFLCITGYLLYYVGDDEVRAVVAWAHWIVGLSLPVVYIVHRLARTRQSQTSTLL